jgi:hypothetical protein
LDILLDKSPKLRNKDMRFGTWNIRSLFVYGRFTSDSIKRTIKIEVRFSGSTGGEIGRWHRTSRRIFICLLKGNENQELGTVFFLHKRIISALKRAESVSDRMSYIILRGRLKVHAPTEDKTDDVKGSFYEELERVLNKFPKML